MTRQTNYNSVRPCKNKPCQFSRTVSVHDISEYSANSADAARWTTNAYRSNVNKISRKSASQNASNSYAQFLSRP